MIRVSKANILGSSEELLPMEEWGFPHLCMKGDLHEFSGGMIGWHWHSAFEIDYINEGEITFHTMNEEIQLHKGCAIFFNHNVLHMMRAGDSGPHSEVYAHFFDEKIITGGIGKAAEQRYVTQIKENPGFNAICLFPDKEQDKKMLDLVKKIIGLCDKEPYGYEVMIRGLLSEFWILLLEQNRSLLNDKPDKRGKNDQDRLRKMMAYIQLHFSDKLVVKDIADTANISTRECSRCFFEKYGCRPRDFRKN